jgi:hypothetical protein
VHYQNILKYDCDIISLISQSNNLDYNVSMYNNNYLSDHNLLVTNIKFKYAK